MLKVFCTALGMIFNDAKSKFMVTNVTDDNTYQAIVDRSVSSCNCDFYNYLGSVFMQDGKTSTSFRCNTISESRESSFNNNFSYL